MEIVLETSRLYLRELTRGDSSRMAEILGDKRTMSYYPSAFSEEKVKAWIEWNMENYRKYGFGLWAVIRRKDGLFLGDCGITMQDIQGEMIPELGYHIHRDHWNKGYGSEAARAVMNYAFEKLQLEQLCSYMKADNTPSRRVAEKNGMHYVKSFDKIVMGEIVQEVLYAIFPAADDQSAEGRTP